MRLSSSSTRRIRRRNSGMTRALRRRRGRGAGREAQREKRSPFATPVDGDASAMRKRDLLHDGQPEAAATNAIGTAAAIERLEQAWQIARGDARPVVFD